MISLVLAMDINRVIGDKDKLPWHYPKDLERYNNLTRGKIVLMGDNTYFSLKGYYKGEKLPYEKIYLASQKEQLEVDFKDNIVILKDLIRFLKEVKEEIFIVGGKTIYELSAPYADYIYLTVILNSHTGDIRLNELKLENFELIKTEVVSNLVFADFKRK